MNSEGLDELEETPAWPVGISYSFYSFKSIEKRMFLRTVVP